MMVYAYIVYIVFLPMLLYCQPLVFRYAMWPRAPSNENITKSSKIRNYMVIRCIKAMDCLSCERPLCDIVQNLQYDNYIKQIHVTSFNIDVILDLDGEILMGLLFHLKYMLYK